MSEPTTDEIVQRLVAKKKLAEAMGLRDALPRIDRLITKAKAGRGEMTGD